MSRVDELRNRAVRDNLADRIAHQAEWRASKAQEYPEDARNATSARGLAELAKRIEEMDADDPFISRLVALADDALARAEVAGHRLASADELVFSSGERAARAIERFRFDVPTETFDGFCHRYVRGFQDDLEALMEDYE